MIKIEKANLDMLSQILELDKNFTYEWPKRLINRKILDPNYIFYVAMYKDKIIGFICSLKGLSNMYTEAFESVENFNVDKNIHIEKVTVDPNYSFKSGNSETKNTLKLLIDETTKGFKTATLNVREFNRAAINSYLKYGFKKLKPVSTYSDGTKKFSMILDILST